MTSQSSEKTAATLLESNEINLVEACPETAFVIDNFGVLDKYNKCCQHKELLND